MKFAWVLKRCPTSCKTQLRFLSTSDDAGAPLPPFDVARRYAEHGRWLLTWQSDRLARIEARAGSGVAVAAILVAFAPVTLGARATDERGFRLVARYAGIVGVVLALASVLITVCFVLLPRSTSAPDVDWVWENWRIARGSPGVNPDVDLSFADHLLTGDGTAPSVLEGFTQFVNRRTRWMKRSTWLLLLAISSVAASSSILTMTRKEPIVKTEKSNASSPAKPGAPTQPVAPSRPKPGQEQHGGNSGERETR